MKKNVVIPNYNGSSLIQQNLPKVYEAVRDYDAVITIVDDCSRADDFEQLETIVTNFKKQLPMPIHVLHHTQNEGFSSTVNDGAHADESDLTVFLNSDVVPEKNFLKSSIEILEKDPSVFGVGSMDKSKEGSKTVLRGRGLGSFQRGFLLHCRGEVDKQNTLWVSGGSSVIRTTLFKKLGGFDENYNPFYWEDIDLSYRALKSGYTLVFNPKSVVEHYHEEGAIKKKLQQQKN